MPTNEILLELTAWKNKAEALQKEVERLKISVAKIHEALYAADLHKALSITDTITKEK